jgi:hypothetical protein
MESANERGQVIVESAILIGVVAALSLACVYVSLRGHKESEKYEFKTYGRKNYDDQIEVSKRKVHKLLD